MGMAIPDPGGLLDSLVFQISLQLIYQLEQLIIVNSIGFMGLADFEVKTQTSRPLMTFTDLSWPDLAAHGPQQLNG